MRFAVTPSDEIHPFRRIAYENDFFAAAGVDEPAHGFPRLIIGFRRFDAEDMSAAMGVAVMVF